MARTILHGASYTRGPRFPFGARTPTVDASMASGTKAATAATVQIAVPTAMNMCRIRNLEALMTKDSK